MSDSSNLFDNPFGKFIPGFDFLQGLVKNAGTAVPGVGQWVAPTLDPDELEKRIQELRTVQFWLEQNAKMLSVTIQAMEVQRMTLATLKTMNVPMADLTESMKMPGFSMPNTAAAAPAPAPAPEPEPPKAAAPKAPAKKSAPKAEAKPDATPPAVDPMKWWGALSEQFTHLATNAIKDGAERIKPVVMPAAKAAAKPAAKPTTKPSTKPAAKPARKKT